MATLKGTAGNNTLVGGFAADSIFGLGGNDNAFGNVLRMQKQLYGGRVIASQLHNPDFVKLAESIGADGIRVEALDQLEPALLRARAAAGVTIVDVVIDSRELPSRYRDRLQQMTSRARASVCKRPNRRSSTSWKDWTPKLSRLTPASRNPSSS